MTQSNANDNLINSAPVKDLTSNQRAFRLVEIEPEEIRAMLAEVPARTPYVMFADYPDIMTREQAAEALSSNIREVGEKLMEGKIRAYRDGRTWRIPKFCLIEYVLKCVERGWYEGPTD